LKRRALCMAGLGLWVSACTTVPRMPAPVAGEVAWSGRMALNVEGERPQAISARFELEGNPRQGRFGLISPLGTSLMQARWRPGQAVLSLPDGQRSYPDMDSLTQDALGERLPVAALFDWLQARPVPGQPSEPRVQGFAQAGWLVDAREQAQGRMSLERQTPAPRVRLRVVFDAAPA